MNITRPELIHVFLIIYLIWSFSEILTRSNRRQAVLPLQLMLVWYVTIFYSVVDYLRLGHTILFRASDQIHYLFLVLFGIGSYIRLKALRIVARSEKDTIIQEGAFARVRYPVLSAWFLQLIGISLAFGSWGGIAILAVTGIPLVMLHIRNEEDTSAAEFGEDFTVYRRKTTRLIPGIW